MSAVVVRYWAAARSAAGISEEAVGLPTAEGSLDTVLAAVRARHDARFARVLASASLLVDGVAVGHRDPAEVPLVAGMTVEVLPPFAGG